MPYVFRDPFSIDYDKLLSEIKEGEFNYIAQKPFKIYNIKAIMENPNTFKRHIQIRNAITRSNPHFIWNQRYFCVFVITEDIAEAFIPSGPNRNEKIEALISEIKESYTRFKSWNPA